MSVEYIITFHTHYEALVFKRAIEKTEANQSGVITIKLIPVPREISSSCGTAIKAELKNESSFDISLFTNIEHDEVFTIDNNGKYISLSA